MNYLLDAALHFYFSRHHHILAEKKELYNNNKIDKILTIFDSKTPD